MLLMVLTLCFSEKRKMPKAIFEFNLPEENEEFSIYSKAIDYRCALSKFDTILKNKKEWSDKYSEIYEEVYTQFRSILSDYDVDDI